MIEHYSALKVIHVFCVFTSITLFMLRGLLMFSGVDWRQSRFLRIFPHAVDTLLLVSGLSMAFLIHQYPFVQSWLTVKVVLLIVYIGLGTYTFRRAQTPLARGVSFAAALLAVAHNPWGVLETL
jgi:uncharacterized membrane protein SirB2